MYVKCNDEAQHDLLAENEPSVHLGVVLNHLIQQYGLISLLKQISVTLSVYNSPENEFEILASALKK